MPVEVIDSFCGVGWLTCGLLQTFLVDYDCIDPEVLF